MRSGRPCATPFEVGRRASSAYCGRYLALRVAEVVRVILIHDVDRHLGHVLGHPVEDRVGAALDVVRHHQVPDREVLLPLVDEGEIAGDGLQYHGVLARLMAQRPGPNLKSGSHTSMSRRRIFMVSGVMKKLLFHSIGTLKAPSKLARSGLRIEPACGRSWSRTPADVRRCRREALAEESDGCDDGMQVDGRIAADPVDRTALHAELPPSSPARASTTAPLSLSVLMSPFWQNAQRMLHEVKKMVPEPSRPR